MNMFVCEITEMKMNVVMLKEKQIVKKNIQN